MIKKNIIIISLCFIIIPMIFAKKKSILIIGSYHAQYQWSKSYERGFKSVLGNQYDLEYFYMDTKRIPANQYQKMADAALKKYNQMKPDLVVLGDDNALQYIGPKLAHTNTPVVFLGINNNPRNYFDKKLPLNITGVLERPLLKRSVAYLKLIYPDMKKVLILFDTGTTAQIILNEYFPNQSNLVINGILVEIKMINNWNKWKKTVINSKQDGYDVAIIGLYQTVFDNKNQNVKEESIIQWTSNNIPIPPFGFWDFSIGPNKAIGGLVLFGEEQGVEAARITQKILDGLTNPASITPVTAKKGQFLFSRSQLKKYNINLPSLIQQKAILID